MQKFLLKMSLDASISSDYISEFIGRKKSYKSFYSDIQICTSNKFGKKTAACNETVFPCPDLLDT